MCQQPQRIDNAQVILHAVHGLGRGGVVRVDCADRSGDESDDGGGRSGGSGEVSVSEFVCGGEGSAGGDGSGHVFRVVGLCVRDVLVDNADVSQCSPRLGFPADARGGGTDGVHDWFAVDEFVLH